MQYSIFKNFIIDIKKEGNRLQKVDVNGKVLTTNKFTQMQLIGLLVALLGLYFLPTGFPEKFAGYTITFMGIFIGMFSSAVIALNNKSKNLSANEDTSYVNLNDLKKSRNHMLQFTGLTAYAMLLGLFIIVMMLLVLANVGFSNNLHDYTMIKSKAEISFKSILTFSKFFLIVIQRFITGYFFFNFFTITTYSVTSYFSHLIAEYKKIKLTNDSI